MLSKFQALTARNFSQRKCELCFGQSLQTLSLLKNLLAKLNRQGLNHSSQQKTVDKEKTRTELQQVNSCYRLLVMIFDPHLKHSSAYRKCPHKQIESVLRSALGVQSAMLDEICDKTAFQIGERNFHLETLTFQIKSFPNTIYDKLNQQNKSQEQNLLAKNSLENDISQERKYQKPSIYKESNEIKIEHQEYIGNNKYICPNFQNAYEYRSMFPLYFFGPNQ